MVKWDEVDNVFLDMDGTLLDLHFDNYFWREYLPRRYAQINDETEEEVRQRLHSDYSKMRGSLEWYSLEFWQDRLQLDIVGLKREVQHKIRLRPQAQEFLVWLKGEEKHVALVSNAHPWSIELKTETVLDSSLFDAIHSSHNHGSPKEAQSFWESFQGDHYFDPDRTLFIDDNEQVLESAKEFGIRHLLNIKNPDLMSEPQEVSAFRFLHDFFDIMPERES